MTSLNPDSNPPGGAAGNQGSDPRSSGNGDSGAIEAWTGSSLRAVTRPVFDKFPAYYRERPELLSPFVEAAEDLLARAVAAFAKQESLASDGSLFGLGPSLVQSNWETAEAIARGLHERLGVMPLVWNGLEVASHAAGGLVFRPAQGRVAVLAWEKVLLPTLPATFRLPPRALPLGTRVEGVILGRMPRYGVPRTGERFAGEVIFRAVGGEIEDDT